MGWLRAGSVKRKGTRCRAFSMRLVVWKWIEGAAQQMSMQGPAANVGVVGSAFIVGAGDETFGFGHSHVRIFGVRWAQSVEQRDKHFGLAEVADVEMIDW
jgi:hypothetical protein